MSIQRGDTVRVLARGKFFGQRVEVLASRTRQGKTWYRLAVSWDGVPRPSWFLAQEIEQVEQCKEAG